MRIEVVNFAKARQGGLEQAEREYLRRLTSELRVEMVELGAGKGGKASDQQARAAEAAALFARWKPGCPLIALDEGGSELTSQQFAELLSKHMNRGTQAICFAIAGPFGWDPAVKKRADMVLSLGRMTFPAHVARFLLVEQIYRALCILKGHPYHK